MARRAVLAVLALAVCVGPLTAQTGERERMRVQLQRAEELARSGQLQDAEAVLRALLDSHPAEPAPILALERVLRRRGELEALLPVLERGLELEPGSVFLRQIQLRALSELSRGDELRRAGEAWLEADPGSEMAYREFATSLNRVGDAAAAERTLESGLTAVDDPVSLAVELADLYLRQGRWFEAAEQWLTVLRGSRGVGWDLVNYKLEALGKDVRPAAEATLEVMSRSDEPGATRLAALAAVYADRPEWARELATRVLREGLSRPEERILMVQLGRVAADRDHQNLAAWAYRRLLASGGGSRLELARRVVEHDLSMGDTVAALGAIARAMAEFEVGTAARRWAWETRIRLLADRDVERAEESYREYARSYPDEPETAALAAAVAEARLRAGDLEEARRVLDRAPRSGLDPAAEARMNTLEAYLDLYQGDYEAARTKLETAVPILDGDGRNRAIRLLRFLRSASEDELRAVAATHRLAARGRAADAYERLAEGLAASPPSAARPALLLWAGELALAGKGLDAAERLLRRVARDHPASGEAPVALMALAEAMSEEERSGEAIELLERLILEYPNSALTPLARRRLAELREEVPSS